MEVLIFIIGLLLGSFFLVYSTRVPKNENFVFSRSKCDHCNKILKWYSLIPIISYVFQKGKCLYCKKEINPLNLIVELSTAILFVIGYYLYGFSYNYVVYLVLIMLLINIFITDFLYMIILDSLLLFSILILLVNKMVFFESIIVLRSIFDGIILFVIMLILGFIAKLVFKKDALGGGDIKLSFIIGYVLGVPLGLVAILFSSFLALPYSIVSVYVSKNNEVPFGPFIMGSFLIVFIFMEKFQVFLDFFVSAF